ncbi:MAG: fasciclin domain-containing protein [Phycisphaerales bacterium]
MNRMAVIALGAAGLVASPSFAQSCAEKKACSSKEVQACGSQGEGKAINVAWEQPQDIVDTAVAAGSFQTLAAALKAAGLVETLKGKGPFTVFAPTDEAFAKLPAGTIDMLLKPENKDKLVAILTYHVVAGSAMAKDVVGMKTATTVNGQRVDIAVKDGKVWLDGKSTVTKTDIACSNGVIHVIDSVIMPTMSDVVTTAVDAGSFTTLAKALTAAGLVETLKGKGPFTVFAPTDEAFAKLPPGTIESLLKPENKDKLTSILTFHVVPGRVYADQVVKMTESKKTVQGQTFSIKVKDGKVIIGNPAAMAQVTATDIEASNGVIHVIDTVLMPK